VPLRITVAVAVHLGMAVKAVGLVRVVLAAAGKERTAQAQVRTEQQILAAAAAVATPV
jgi:hypothetical protein